MRIAIRFEKHIEPNGQCGPCAPVTGETGTGTFVPVAGRMIMHPVNAGGTGTPFPKIDEILK